MKAFVVDKYIKNAPLRLATLPEPVVGPDDILVQVHAAGVNPLDGKIRDGAFKLFLPYRPPFTLGHDVAGTIVKLGTGAAFAILDLESMVWRYERIAYPIELTQGQMQEARLPRRLIDRLSFGW